MVDPMCAMLLTDNEEANDTKSNTLNDLPHRAILLVEREDPNSKELITESA
jgi:hypothetical protein